MKKYFLLSASVIFYLTICSYTHAQKSNAGEGSYKFSITAASGYAPEHIAEKPPKKTKLYLNNINIRARRDFIKRYEQVNDETWTILPDGRFWVTFITNGINHTVYYGKNGNWMSSIKYYMEDKLPFKVRDRAKREYYDFVIAFVEEVETLKSNGIPTYFIRMEDKQSYKFVRVCDGEMNVWKAFEKQ